MNIGGIVNFSGLTAVQSSATTANITSNGATSLITKGFADLNYTGVSGTPTLPGLNVFTNTNTFPTIKIGGNVIITDISNSRTRYGYNALNVVNAVDASYNTAFGYETLLFNTSGYDNTAVGYRALRKQVSNPGCTAVGSLAGQAVTGAYNTCVGWLALGASSHNGINNTSIGAQSMLRATGGYENTAVGVASLVEGGYQCVAVGSGALSQNPVTSGNSVAVGYKALSNNSGPDNIGIGYFAGLYSTTGDRNIFIGSNSGGGANSGAVGSIYIGAGTSTAGNFSNSTALGTNVQITATNQMTLGNFVQTVLIPGRINLTNYTITTVTASSTLSTPLTGGTGLTPMIFTDNSTNDITITLLSPTFNNNTSICIRKGLGATGIVSVAHSSIVSVSGTSDISGSINNGTCSSYVFRISSWYQTSFFP